MMHGPVIGLDLSLHAAAVVVIPQGWVETGLMSWPAIRSATFGGPLPKENSTPEDQILRLDEIVEGILDFIVIYTGHANVVRREVKPAFVAVEEYAFSRGASRAHALGEVGGCVKHAIYRRFGIAPVPVTASHARKILVGTVPQKKTSGIDPKEFVARKLRAMGANFATYDENDAFVVANWGLGEIGRAMLSTPEST